MQKVVPIIIHSNNDDIVIVIPPILKLYIEIATAIITAVTTTDILLLLDLKYFSANVSTVPTIAPIPNDTIISNKGSNIIVIKLYSPEETTFATPNEIAKTTSPTASSIATTGSKISVNFPFALY